MTTKFIPSPSLGQPPFGVEIISWQRDQLRDLSDEQAALLWEVRTYLISQGYEKTNRCLAITASLRKSGHLVEKAAP